MTNYNKQARSEVGDGSLPNRNVPNTAVPNTAKRLLGEGN